MLNVNRVRNDFPILKRKIDDKRLIYLDNAATSQKPKQVVEAIREYYEVYNANVHRSVHRLSEEATEAYESSREVVARFIGARSSKEIIFLRNATEAINLVSHSWAAHKMSSGDTIALTVMEHNSNLVPWQIVSRKNNLNLAYMDVSEEGTLDEEMVKLVMDKKPKLVAVTQASNVLGTLNDVKLICKMAREIGCISVVDAAQSVPHMPVDVEDMGCDFLAFTGHKMLGPTGIGVLYGREELLEEMPPFLSGGEMIKDVNFYDSIWNEVPWKFEAGTPNIEGAIGLRAAIEYLKGLGMENVLIHDRRLTSYLLPKLGSIDNIKVYGPKDAGRRLGIVSFNITGVHPHDLAMFLDMRGIAVRSGQHCCHVLMKRLNIPGTVRASFYIYNDLDDADELISALESAKGVLSS
ncbi:MAG: cysteine desulfurase [Candidatus Bathyarchaeia archaeon]